MSHKFAVDNGPEDEEINIVLDLLKNTIELGKRAEQAMNDICNVGYHSGEVTLHDKTTLYNGHGSLRRVRLAQYVEPSRDKAPILSDLNVVCGKVTNDSHGGHHFKSTEITLFGTRVEQIERKLITNSFSSVMGLLRLRKTGLSIELQHAGKYNKYDVAQIYKKPGGASMISYKEIARCVADHIVLYPQDFEENETQLTHDLREKVRGWLISEGIVQRLSTSLFEQAKVVEVMNA